jgi:hypothetical protein
VNHSGTPPSRSRIQPRQIERAADRTPTLTSLGHGPPTRRRQRGFDVIVLGIVLLVLGFLLHISILWTLGIILLVVGAVLALLGGTGRAIGGRRHWY